MVFVDIVLTCSSFSAPAKSPSFPALLSAARSRYPSAAVPPGCLSLASFFGFLGGRGLKSVVFPLPTRDGTDELAHDSSDKRERDRRGTHVDETVGFGGALPNFDVPLDEGVDVESTLR